MTKNYAKGFSLTELMVSVVVGAFLMMGAYQVMTRSTKAQTETAQDANFVRYASAVQQSVDQVLDQIGYNPNLTAYETVPTDSTNYFRRRIGIVDYYSGYVKFYADRDRNGEASDNELFHIASRDSEGLVENDQSEFWADPCTPKSGETYQKKFTLYLERGNPEVVSTFSKTPLAENVRCAEFQFLCEINLKGDTAPGSEPRADLCNALPESVTGDPNPEKTKASKLKRWTLTTDVNPWGLISVTDPEGNTKQVDQTDILAVPRNIASLSSGEKGAEEYYRFIRDKIRVIRFGAILEGPCENKLKEKNPLTNDYCPTKRIFVEKRINPGWNPNMAIACIFGTIDGAPDPRCPSQNTTVAETNSAYPDMNSGGQPNVPDPPTGDDGTGGPPSSVVPRWGGSPILTNKTGTGGATSTSNQ